MLLQRFGEIQLAGVGVLTAEVEILLRHVAFVRVQGRVNGLRGRIADGAQRQAADDVGVVGRIDGEVCIGNTAQERRAMRRWPVT